MKPTGHGGESPASSWARRRSWHAYAWAARLCDGKRARRNYEASAFIDALEIIERLDRDSAKAARASRAKSINFAAASRLDGRYSYVTVSTVAIKDILTSTRRQTGESQAQVASN